MTELPFVGEEIIPIMQLLPRERAGKSGAIASAALGPRLSETVQGTYRGRHCSLEFGGKDGNKNPGVE